VKLHLIDFEGSARSGVVEFGVVSLAGGAGGTWEIEALATEVCRPEEVPSEAEVAIHQLREGDWEGKGSFREYYQQFLAWRQSGYFGAHHAAVENAFLTRVWPFTEPVPDPGEEDRFCHTWGPWADTLVLTRRAWPQLAEYGLSRVVAALGLEGELEREAGKWIPVARRRYHCAPYDALASALIVIALSGHVPYRHWTAREWVHASDSTAGLSAQGELF
jgi:DNA polymerase III epsilon subunit-like protein